MRSRARSRRLSAVNSNSSARFRARLAFLSFSLSFSYSRAHAEPSTHIYICIYKLSHSAAVLSVYRLYSTGATEGATYDADLSRTPLSWKINDSHRRLDLCPFTRATKEKTLDYVWRCEVRKREERESCLAFCSRLSCVRFGFSCLEETTFIYFVRITRKVAVVGKIVSWSRRHTFKDCCPSFTN